MTAATTQSTPTTATATMRRARRARRGVQVRIVAPLIVVVAFALAGVFGPILTGYDHVDTDLAQRLLPPGTVLANGSTAIFGTDQVGRDLFAQMMMGARVSMALGAATLVLAGIIGVVLGLLAGFFGGVIDMILMRLADIQLAFPSILLAILVASVLGQGIVNLVIVLAISSWVVFARVTRSQVLALKNREYVDAARTLGAGNLHLIFRTLLPGCVAPILVVATVQLGHVILAEAALSFLGLGVPIDTPSWGATIANGRDYLADAWWISTLPGFALAALVLTTGVLGDALRDRFDPRLRST